MQSIRKAAGGAVVMLALCAAAAADEPTSAAPTAPVAPGASSGPGGGFTVGDVLSRGGRQLTEVELKAFLPGTRWYTSIVGKPYVVTILPDRTWKGEAGRRPQFLGRWRIDDQGRYCSLLESRGEVSVTAEESCLHYLRAGDDYFVSTASEPASEAIPQRLLE